MKPRGRERGRRSREGSDFGDSPYSCPGCLLGIDSASTTLESGVVRGVCSGCGKTIGFVDRSASVELAERWAIDPAPRAAPAPRRDETRPVEVTTADGAR